VQFRLKNHVIEHKVDGCSNLIKLSLRYFKFIAIAIIIIIIILLFLDDWHNIQDQQTQHWQYVNSLNYLLQI
jgi:DMSO/TMAO reductase YedYZ heme-binding membrane subunit